MDLLDSDNEEDMDDPQEVVMEGSDEEFGDLQDLNNIEDGMDINENKPIVLQVTIFSYR